MKQKESIQWDIVPPTIGWNRVKALRKKRGLTQLQVASGAGVGLATLGAVEAGMENRLTDSTRAKIAAFFGVSVPDIFPAEMMGMIPLEQWIGERKFEILSKGKKGT